jgi:competence protein ComEA
MHWDVSAIIAWLKAKEQPLQLLVSAAGLTGMVYGLHVLMVERTNIPICSAEVLAAAGKGSFLEEQQLTVEVAGAVVEPGVWQLAVGSRVAEAIKKAGGFSQRADRTFAAQGLNLARNLQDGEKIYVPFTGEAQPGGQQLAQPATSQSVSQSTNLISINQASAEKLQTLTGIGEARAAQIVENRPYTTVDELLQKKILSETVFGKIKGQLTL